MKIGFSNDTITKEMTDLCDYVIEACPEQNIIDSLLTFVEKHSTNELVFQGIEALNLQTSQLLPVLEKINQNESNVTFINKGNIPKMSDNDFFITLLTLAKHDKLIRSNRVKEALFDAKRRGKAIGRPSLDQATVSLIERLHKNHDKSIREIAAICDVGVGTVHKYLKTQDAVDQNLNCSSPTN